MSISPESVQQQLQSEDVGDRLQGLNNLRQLEPKIAFEAIQKVIKDGNVRVRYAATSQLATVGNQDRQLALTLLRDSLHEDPEIDVQAAAADAIGGLKLSEAFEDLEQKYKDTTEWILKVSIIAALGEMGDSRGFKMLKDAIENGEPLVQTVAISSLGELGDRRAVELLLPLASYPDWQIRHRVAAALGLLGGEEVISILEELAEDKTEIVALTARSSLESIQA